MREVSGVTVYVLYLDRCLGYIDIFICHNLINIHLKFAKFIIYKLCHEKIYIQ